MGQVVSTVVAEDGKLDAPGKLPMVFQLQAVQEVPPVCMILRVRGLGSLGAPVRLFVRPPLLLWALPPLHPTALYNVIVRRSRVSEHGRVLCVFLCFDMLSNS